MSVFPTSKAPLLPTACASCQRSCGPWCSASRWRPTLHGWNITQRAAACPRFTGQPRSGCACCCTTHPAQGRSLASRRNTKKGCTRGAALKGITPVALATQPLPSASRAHWFVGAAVSGACSGVGMGAASGTDSMGAAAFSGAGDVSAAGAGADSGAGLSDVSGVDWGAGSRPCTALAGWSVAAGLWASSVLGLHAVSATTAVKVANTAVHLCIAVSSVTTASDCHKAA